MGPRTPNRVPPSKKPATKEAQRADIAHTKANGGARAYKGRKPSYSRKQFESAQVMLGEVRERWRGRLDHRAYSPDCLPYQG